MVSNNIWNTAPWMVSNNSWNTTPWMVSNNQAINIIVIIILWYSLLTTQTCILLVL
jgi:hypothetical protein